MPVPERGNAGWRLQQWQSALQACIVDPLQDREPLRAWLQPGSVDSDIQLDIYVNAYALRLIEALRCNYPALHQALGDADFDVMARAYLDRYPSTRASIRWFGAALDEFLRARPPWCEVPVLSELAAFEWAIRHTIDAADADRLSVDDLLAVPAHSWNGLQFDLHPSVSLLSLAWNAPPLWRALTGMEDAIPGETITPVRQPMHWLVYRKPDLACGWRSLSDRERTALDHLHQGATFADLCAGIAEHGTGDAAQQAADWLRLWVETGILVARRQAPEPETMTTHTDREPRR
jgi:Putative DNA-binding domain